MVMSVQGGKPVTLTAVRLYEGRNDVHTIGRNASHRAGKFLVSPVEEQRRVVFMPVLSHSFTTG
jgi:hypothetical protein